MEKFMEKDNLLNKRYSCGVTPHQEKRLIEIQKKMNIPISRLITIALENELNKEKPFTYDLTIPTDEFVEYAYIDEAGKIITFLMKYKKGLSLQFLALNRNEMGIPDIQTFLYAFRECLVKGFIIEITKVTRNTRIPYIAYTCKHEK
jgi:hypothetical protein